MCPKGSYTKKAFDKMENYRLVDQKSKKLTDEEILKIIETIAYERHTLSVEQITAAALVGRAHRQLDDKQQKDRYKAKQEKVQLQRTPTWHIEHFAEHVDVDRYRREILDVNAEKCSIEELQAILEKNVNGKLVDDETARNQMSVWLLSHIERKKDQPTPNHPKATKGKLTKLRKIANGVV